MIVSDVLDDDFEDEKQQDDDENPFQSNLMRV